LAPTPPALTIAKGRVEEQVFAAAQSGITVSFSASTPVKWSGIIADAITADIIGTARSSAFMSLGIG